MSCNWKLVELFSERCYSNAAKVIAFPIHEFDRIQLCCGKTYQSLRIYDNNAFLMVVKEISNAKPLIKVIGYFDEKKFVGNSFNIQAIVDDAWPV